jgi:hypothetical protein
MEIRIGAVIGALTGGFIIPLMVVFAAQIYRIESHQRDFDGDPRGKAPVWTWLTLASGGVVAVPLALPLIFWGAAAYTATRSPDATAVLHDLAMLLFITGSQFYIFPWVAMTVASFMPKTVPHNPFPRWFGYFNIFITVTFEFGVPPLLTRTGVWAWNGLLGWWTPVTTLGIWFVVVYVLLFKAINAQMAEEERAAPASRGVNSDVDKGVAAG